MSMPVLVDGSEEEKGFVRLLFFLIRQTALSWACAGEYQCLPGLFMDVWKRDTW